MSGGGGERRGDFERMPTLVAGEQRKQGDAGVDGQSDGIKLCLGAGSLSFIWSFGEQAILQAAGFADAGVNFRPASESMEESGSVHDGVGESDALERVRLARGSDGPREN